MSGGKPISSALYFMKLNHWLCLGSLVLSDVTSQGAEHPLPSEVQTVAGEAVTLKEGPPDTFLKGSYLAKSRSLGEGHGPSAPRIVDPSSIVVKKGDEVFVAGKDYALDPLFGTLGTLPGGRLLPGDAVNVSYRYSFPRIDSLIRYPDGSEAIVKGTAVVGGPKPPAISEGAVRLANFYLPPFCKGDDAERLDIPEVPEMPPTATTTGLVPATLAKLKNGEQVKMVCWGDSVTYGGDASSKEKSFPHQLAAILRAKFPKASIDLEVVAVGGSGSVHWLFPEEQKHPTQQAMCDWNRVAAARPDLVVMEFVNDSYLRGEKFQKHYKEALRRVKELGSELILVAPHFIYMEGMGLRSLKGSDERPYIKELKSFAAANGLALADTSGAWGNLWRKGIPYLSYLKNGINHPDDEGHLLMAEEISRCFN